jgi:rRNA maturation endonuclease Nob1
MPASEINPSDLMKKILARKEKVVKEVKEEESPATIKQEEVTEVVDNSPPSKQSRFNPVESDDRMDDVADMGNMTAADLRKNAMGKFFNVKVNKM